MPDRDLPPRHVRRIAWSMWTLLFLATFLMAWYTNAGRLGTMLTHKSDPLGYYQYLPALLGTHDWLNMPYVILTGEDIGASVFTYGVALMQSPFFALACIVAGVTGLPVDGYSMPFVFAQFAASAFYLASGSVLLFLALRRKYSERASLLVPVLLFGATNLYFYGVCDTGMSHVYSYFLFAWMYYLTLRILEMPRADRLAGLIIVAAFIVLVRQPNGLALLFPLLCGAGPLEALRQRIRWVMRHPGALVTGLGAAAALWIPQLFYWKVTTGSWLVFVYGLNGQAFDPGHPHLLDVLASPQNGWFIYTPLMGLVMSVLLLQAWRGVWNARLVLIIWAFVWYIYASWWSWWLGGSFGYRGFIECQVLFAPALAWVMEGLMRRSRMDREVTFIGFAVLAFLNIRLSHIYEWPWEGPDWDWGSVSDVYVRALFG